MHAIYTVAVSVFLLASAEIGAKEMPMHGEHALTAKASVKTPSDTLSKNKCNTTTLKKTNNLKSDVDGGKAICLTFNGKSIAATLNNSPTSKDLISMLPISLTFKDYANTEKIAYLPRKLSVTDAPAGLSPSVGDITYYAPWGNIAIFYKKSDVGFANGLISLGKIVEGVDHLPEADGATIRIEVIE